MLNSLLPRKTSKYMDSGKKMHTRCLSINRSFVWGSVEWVTLFFQAIVSAPKGTCCVSPYSLSHCNTLSSSDYFCPLGCVCVYCSCVQVHMHVEIRGWLHLRVSIPHALLSLLFLSFQIGYHYLITTWVIRDHCHSSPLDSADCTRVPMLVRQG